MSLTLLYISVALLLILLVYYLGIFAGSVFTKPHETNASNIPVSVIVYAKNNIDQLRTLLPILLNQNYHQFELVVVNNASTDETPDLLKEYTAMYPNIRIVDVVNNEAFWGNKKYALTLGIKASKYEYLVFVDAENTIHSNNWLVQMSSHFTLNKTLIIGTSYYPKSKGFFNKFMRFDHTMQQIQSLAWSKIGKPHSLQLHNMAFKKEAFYEVNGFINHVQQRAFTNEYFLNDAGTSKNTVVCEQPETMVEIPLFEDKAAFREFKQQQLSLLKSLNGGTAFKIKFFNFCQLLFFISIAGSLILWDYAYITIGIFALRYLLLWIIFAKAAKKYHYKDLIILFPVLDMFYIFMQVRLFLKSIFTKSQ
ncbi:MAG TPA: glycosyltransferase [Flavobacterium sp.]|nr:glycosyltransferase [Flavobacterium sp.]